jgi:quercetin dioxygenase-like cupin family protein
MSEANTSSTIVRKALLSASVKSPRAAERVEVKEIELAPGQATGLHRHPCHVVGYIAAGSILFQVEGQPSKLLKAGDAFHEPENARMLHFDNASNSAPARFVAFYLLGAAEERLIEMLDAC